MRRNILEYLEQTACRVPDKAAICSEQESLAFRQLQNAARAIGSGLIRDGHDHGAVVVFMKKRPQTIGAFLGVIYSGCFYVPLDEEMPRHRIQLIFQTLDAGALICDETTEALARELN